MKPVKIVLIIITFVLSSCSNLLSNQKENINNIPDSEIVYYLQPEENKGIIGFINTDGSSKTEFDVTYRKGLFFINNFIKYEVTIDSPPMAWNRSLKILGLVKNSSIRLGAGYPILVDQKGEVFECDEKTSPWTTSNYIIQDDNRIIIIDEKDLNNVEIVEFNMKTCQREKILYKASTNERILSFSISSDKKVAISKEFSMKDGTYYKTDIFVKDFHNIHSINNAIAFRWGGNGMRFFYFDIQKEKSVVCEDINVLCKMNNEKMYSASWSIDDKYLIFEDSGKIFTKDMTNQTIKYITDGYDPISER